MDLKTIAYKSSHNADMNNPPLIPCSIVPEVRSAEELLHELQLHQIELEMQNEELQRAHNDLKESHDRYAALYDFAPVGYLTLTHKGLITEINLTAAGLLRVDRCELLNRRFSAFVIPQDGDRWHLFFVGVLKHKKRQNIELTLRDNDGNEVPVQLDCLYIIADGQSPILHIAITDITNIKETEAALRKIDAYRLTEQFLKESEIYQRSIFNATPDAMLISDEKGVITQANQQCENLLGYSVNELIGLSIEMLLPERFREAHPALRAQFAGLGDCRSMSGRPGVKAVRKDGSEVDVEISLSTIKTNRGGFHASALRDISKHKQMVEAIIASEKKFRCLAETMPHIVWITRADGWNIYLNQQWADYTGLTFEESHGDGWVKPLHPDDRHRTWEAWQNAVNNNAPYLLECRLRRADGIYRWWLVCGKPILDDSGKVYEWVGTCTDIHSIKEVEKTLRDKEYLLAESQRLAHIGSWSLNLATGHLSWSDEMYRIYGVRPETFAHSVTAFLDLVHPDDCASIKIWIGDCMSGKKMRELDFRIMLPDGTIRFIRGGGELQNDEIGKPSIMIGSAQDITERVYLAQQDKQHLDELAHVTRLGLMGEMASGIAHEVNQPLTAISSYAQVCLNLINNEHLDLTLFTSILAKMQQQALRAGRIIHRMKEFLKSNAKRSSTVDINTLILNCVELCASELKQNNVELTLKLENNLPSIIVDSIQIEQVLINLIRNSTDALGASLENSQHRLAIHSQLTPDNSVQVRVKDNGPGLNAEQRQKILTPFYTTKASGMGMGLSICRSLIEAHGGALKFNSEYGKGTTFYFTLPIETAERKVDEC